MDIYRTAVEETIVFLETYINDIEHAHGQNATSSDGLLNIADCRNLVLRHEYFFMFPVHNNSCHNDSALASCASQLDHVVLSCKTQTQNPPQHESKSIEVFPSTVAALPEVSFVGFIDVLLKFREIEQSAFWLNPESHTLKSGIDYTQLQCSENEFRLLSRSTTSTSHSRQYRFDLQVKTLSPDVAYNALSYCWGSPLEIPEIYYDPILRRWWDSSYWESAKFPLFINENIVLIPANLADFIILGLSPQDESFLWIDFFCVNQIDAHDKTLQLNLMHKVYEQAERVLLWLGTPSAETSIVDSLLKIFTPILDRQISKASYVDSSLTDATYLKFLENAGVTVQKCLALWSHFCALWGLRNAFQRRWILQELYLNTNVMGLLGKARVPLWTLFSLYGHFVPIWMRTLLGTEDESILGPKFMSYGQGVMLGLQLQLRRMVHEAQSETKITKLSKQAKLACSAMFVSVILAEVYSFKCAFPQDSLIALQAIMQRICDGFGIVNLIPIIQQVPSEIMFQQFAASCLLADPNLLLLLQCHLFPRRWFPNPDDELKHRMSSWVPQFHKISRSPYQIHDAMYQTILEFDRLDPFHVDIATNPKFDTSVLSRRSIQDNRLHLRGLNFSHIHACLSYNEKDNEPLPDFGSRYQDLLREYLETHGYTLSMCEKFLRSTNTRYSTLAPTDSLIEYYLYYSVLEQLFRRDLEQAEIVRLKGLDLARSVGVDLSTIDMIPTTEPISYEFFDPEIFSAIGQFIFDRVLAPSIMLTFLTTGRMAGLGPLSQREGDQIWLLEGARFLLVLRQAVGPSDISMAPMEKTFRIIGFCRIDGFAVDDVVSSGAYPWEDIIIV